MQALRLERTAASRPTLPHQRRYSHVIARSSDNVAASAPDKVEEATKHLKHAHDALAEAAKHLEQSQDALARHLQECELLRDEVDDVFRRTVMLAYDLGAKLGEASTDPSQSESSGLLAKPQG